MINFTRIALNRFVINSIFSFIMMLSFVSFGQTNPAAQTLPYSQNFSTFTGSTTTYPAGWQGWDITGSLGTTYPTTAPSVDRALTAGTNALTSRGIYDMNTKMGIA